MWQRFTERSRRVVFFAQEETQRLGSSVLNSEHLLLGLLRETDSVALRILDRLGLRPGDIRSRLEALIPAGDPGRTGQKMQLAPGAKRVIDLAYDEARQLNNNYIGTEHLLLGLIREEEGPAAGVLVELGANLERTRREVMALQDQDQAKRPGGPRRRPATPLPPGDLGVLRPAADRTGCDVAFDEDAFVALAAALRARDHHGYRALRNAGRSVSVPTGVAIKVLVFDPGGLAAAEGGCRVRLLGGDWEGRAGWVARGCIEITGPDERPFPPAPDSTGA